MGKTDVIPEAGVTPEAIREAAIKASNGEPREGKELIAILRSRKNVYGAWLELLEFITSNGKSIRIREKDISFPSKGIGYNYCDPAWLKGRAKFLYDQCDSLGLQPKIEYVYISGGGSGYDDESWFEIKIKPQ